MNTYVVTGGALLALRGDTDEALERLCRVADPSDPAAIHGAVLDVRGFEPASTQQSRIAFRTALDCPSRH